MSNTLILKAVRTMTAPLPGTPVLRLAGDVLVRTSDTFTGPDATSLAGRATDARSGGSSLPYLFTNAAAFGLSGGKVVPGSSTGVGVALVEISPAAEDVTAQVRVLALDPAAGSGQTSFLVCRRSSLASPTSQIRLGLSSSMASLFTQTGGGSQEYVAGSATPVAAGDVVGIREYRGLVQMLINGSVAAAAQFPAGTFPGSHAGLTKSAGASFAFDDLKISETIR